MKNAILHWQRWCKADAEWERLLRIFEKKLQYGVSLGNSKVILFTSLMWKHRLIMQAKPSEVLNIFLFPTMQIEICDWHMVVKTRVASSHSTTNRMEPTTKTSLASNISSQSTMKTPVNRRHQKLSKLGKFLHRTYWYLGYCRRSGAVEWKTYFGCRNVSACQWFGRKIWGKKWIELSSYMLTSLKWEFVGCQGDEENR